MSSFAVPNDQETNDAIIFGHQVAWLIEEFAQYRRIVAHFHEWLAGVGLILLAQKKAKYAPNPMQSDPTQCNQLMWCCIQETYQPCSQPMQRSLVATCVPAVLICTTNSTSLYFALQRRLGVLLVVQLTNIACW
jgi:hypothetical protein